MRPRGPETLAGLKRYLADGGTLTLTEATGLPAHKFLGVTRTAPDARPGSERVRLEPGGSYLGFGKASEWAFDPDASTATMTDGAGESWAAVLTYRLGDATANDMEEGAAYYVEYLSDGIAVGIYGIARRSPLSDRWVIEGHGTDEGCTVRLDRGDVIECHKLGPEAQL